jgi:arsenate reductase
MAEGLLRHDAGDRFEVFSAGTKPSHVRTEAITVMRELDIDIAGQRSKSVDEFSGQHFDFVLTVCDNAKESCPIFPGQTVAIHRNFDDPAALQGSEQERLAAFRRVRDEIRRYLRDFPPTDRPEPSAEFENSRTQEGTDRLLRTEFHQERPQQVSAEESNQVERSGAP